MTTLELLVRVDGGPSFACCKSVFEPSFMRVVFSAPGEGL